MLIVALGLAGLTASRVRVWHDELTLWTDATQKAPLRPRPWVNLGRAQQLTGDLFAANQSYHRAIALSFDPRRQRGASLYAELAAETDLASLMLEQGNLVGAQREIDLVLRNSEWPLFPYAVFQSGILDALQGRCELALLKWRAASAAEGTLHVPPLPKTCPGASS